MGTTEYRPQQRLSTAAKRNPQGSKPPGGGGSRRIFSARFKLRVLDSYRKDPDCRGNQRATARKYGIHRRQIQKWLQTENNLRRTAIGEGQDGEEAPPGGDGKSSSGSALNPQQHQARQPDDATPTTTLTTPHTHTHTTTTPTPTTTSSSSEGEEDEEITSDNSESSLYEQDRALDLTCSALSKRRFFSESFKLEVVDAFYSDPEVKANQRATARKYGVHRRQVQKWIEDQASLRAGSDTCLDLSSKKRKCEDNTCCPYESSLSPPPLKKPSYEELHPLSIAEQPSSVQETALCLVKHRETPPEERVTSSVQEGGGYTIYRPYEDVVTMSSTCCATPPRCRYLPYYGLIDASYVTECLSHDIHYYRQTVHDVALYAPMYS